MIAGITAGAAAQTEPPADPPPVKIHYGEEGLQVDSADGRFSARIGLRGQFRWSYPLDDEPITADEFIDPDDATFAINRARVKLGGHTYAPWLQYSTEYDLLNNQLLDLRFTFARWPAFQFRLGQWKPEYNRERRDSSGEQQFVDRSIANRTFTIDRQPGMMVTGHIFRGTPADSWYYAGVFSGAGLNNFDNEGTPMWMARYQWNFLGRDLEFSQSDVEIQGEPAGSVAVATVSNRSRYTRFSSSGGGELEGFPSDIAERYDVRQALVEGAYQHRGLSLQGEYHRKQIDDRETGVQTTFDGGYAQVGFFFHSVWPSVPRPLEFALRGAVVDEDTPGAPVRQELSSAANWFFAGHRNKLTLELSRLTLEDPVSHGKVWRIRFQWDVSI
jgi:phosphate-selective porin OprO/OprP